jgi:hypothetical protein
MCSNDARRMTTREVLLAADLSDKVDKFLERIKEQNAADAKLLESCIRSLIDQLAYEYQTYACVESPWYPDVTDRNLPMGLRFIIVRQALIITDIFFPPPTDPNPPRRGFSQGGFEILGGQPTDIDSQIFITLPDDKTRTVGQFPFYKTVNGDATTFSLTNTSVVATVAAKVRFRDQVKSRDVLDFIVILNPNDKFEFYVRQNGGVPTAYWTYNNCVVGYPGTVYDNNKALPFPDLSIPGVPYADSAVGHVEVIGMLINGLEEITQTSRTYDGGYRLGLYDLLAVDFPSFEFEAFDRHQVIVCLTDIAGGGTPISRSYVSATTLAVALAPAICFGVAFDINRNPNTGAGTIVTDSTGDSVLFPVYTTVNNDATSFFLTNTSMVETIAAKVRFRDQVASRDVLDFIVILSPNDKFDFFVMQDGGVPTAYWADNKCVVGYPGTVYDDNKMLPFPDPSISGVPYAESAVGHMEVIGMLNLNDPRKRQRR